MCDKCLCRQLLWLLAPSLGQFVTRRSLGLKDVRTGMVLRVSFLPEKKKKKKEFPGRWDLFAFPAAEGKVSLFPSANNMESLFLKHFLLTKKQNVFVKG